MGQKLVACLDPNKMLLGRRLWRVAGWMPRGGEMQKERFCVHCSAPIYLLPVLSIMQFFVSRFVPFVLEWWKLEISLARWFIQYTQFFVPQSVFRCLRLLCRAPEVLCKVTGSNNAEYLADIA